MREHCITNCPLIITIWSFISSPCLVSYLCFDISWFTVAFFIADNPRIAEAGSIWMETRDAAKALAAIGNHHCLERSLLEGLSKRGSKDLVNALSCIPRHMRQMYIHSYQSFIWNRITSRRIRELGIQPVLGDLVQRNKRGISRFNSVISSMAQEGLC